MKANTIIRRFGRFAACVAMLAAAACTGNFEDYNTKPFRPSDDDLNGDNVGVGILFPAMMEFRSMLRRCTMCLWPTNWAVTPLP